MSGLDPNIYTVAWIAPLEIEAQAALHMLDHRHRGGFATSRGDDYVFHAGNVFGHNVIIATLPAGQEYGTGSAAALASQVKRFFPNLRFGLLVGIAAGIPDFSRIPPRDIRLGDVIVALPEGDSPAVVAYDLGKESSDFQLLHSGRIMAATETIVRSAIGSIKSQSPNDASIFLKYYSAIKDKEHGTGTFADPGQSHDTHYEVDDYGRRRRVERQPRPASQRTRVWYGPIGSGEKLMKNARKRNELRDRYGIIGLEMEAAGVMNRIPVGVVRGVCDYGDEQKDKEWQPYAAAMAASYAKAILSEIVPSETTAMKKSPSIFAVGMSINEGFIKRKRIAESLDKLLPLPKHHQPCQSAALCGLGGSGKTQIALDFVYQQHKTNNCSIFWAHADSEETFKQDYKDIAAKLSLAGNLDGEAFLIAVKNRIEEEARWVLVIDNADDLGLFKDNRTTGLRRFVPNSPCGTVLWTSRDRRIVGSLVGPTRGIEVDRMTDDEAQNLFSTVQGVTACQNDAMKLLEELGFLPLAISQAAAYMRRTGMPASEYLETLETVLGRPQEDPHRRYLESNSIFQTWNISVDHIRRENRMAYNILHILSFLDGKSIPWNIVQKAAQFEARNQRDNCVRSGSLNVDGKGRCRDGENYEEILVAVTRLCEFFFLSRVDTGKKTGEVAIHKLVQHATQESLGNERLAEGTAFAEVALQIVTDLFPESSPETWEECDKYLTHAMHIVGQNSWAGKREPLDQLASKVSRYLYDRGRWTEKRRVDQVTLDRQQKELDEEHPAIIKSMTELATSFHKLGEYNEAEKTKEKVLALQRNILAHQRRIVSERLRETLNSQASLADTHFAQGKYMEAETTYQEVLEQQKALLEKKDPDRVATMASLAAVYHARGKYREAEERKREVLELRQQSLGPSHPDTISSLESLAATYHDQGKYAEAETVSREALNLRREKLGEEHPDTIESRVELAITHYAMRNYDEAERNFRDVLKRRKRLLGEEHPDTIRALALLATACFAQGRNGEGEKNSQEAYRLRYKVLGEKHPDTIVSMGELAATHHSKKKYEDAEKLKKQVLDLRREVLGEEHPDTIESMAELAETYHAQNKHDKARDLHGQALALRKKVLGNSHPDTVRSMASLGAM